MSATISPQQTGTQTVASGAFGAFPVSLGYYPIEGSRAVTAQYNWTAQAGFAEDLSQLVAWGIETAIQAGYVDNGSNSQSVTITIPATGQVITCPANSQGFFPLLFTGTPAFQITTPFAIAAVTRVILLNVPVNPCVWHV